MKPEHGIFFFSQLVIADNLTSINNQAIGGYIQERM
jgi:hypothetical protein